MPASISMGLNSSLIDGAQCRRRGRRHRGCLPRAGIASAWTTLPPSVLPSMLADSSMAVWRCSRTAARVRWKKLLHQSARCRTDCAKSSGVTSRSDAARRRGNGRRWPCGRTRRSRSSTACPTVARVATFSADVPLLDRAATIPRSGSGRRADSALTLVAIGDAGGARPASVADLVAMSWLYISLISATEASTGAGTLATRATSRDHAKP